MLVVHIPAWYTARCEEAHSVLVVYCQCFGSCGKSAPPCFTELSGLVLSYSTTVFSESGQTQHTKAQRDEKPKK